MLNEEIARLTGTLKFNVEARPLVAFEKRLGGVLVMLRELSTLANKKFTVKVSLDSRSLRSQIEKATKTKISLTNVDVSDESLRLQGKRIQEYLDKTTINLKNVRFDLAALTQQKRFVKTLMGQMSLDLPIKLGITKLETELRRELKGVSDRNPLKVRIEINNNNIAMKIRRAMIEAQRRMGELKIRVSDPQVRLKVDRQHLIDEIRAAIATHEFNIRVGARSGDIQGRVRREREGSGRRMEERGLSAAMGFARGAIPGLGAAFAISQLNDINQRVTAATNSLEAVSGSEANFRSNKNYLDNMSKEMGLNFRDVAPQYSSIFQAAGPSIGVKGTQDMFRGIMQYGTVHGLDKEAMKGSMVALSQMFGKDKIQSEEARQQFAERMPNGMALLAEAAKNAGQIQNGTVKEFGALMQAGDADPKKILPELGRLMKKLSEENDAYKKSLETTRVAQGRMNHEFETAVTIFSNAGFDKGMSTFFNTTAEALARAKPLIEGLGAAFEILMTPVTAFIHLLGVLGENWQKFADKLGISKTALTTFASALGIFMLPFGGFAIAVGGLIVALDDLATYMNGGDSLFGKWAKETPGAQEAVDKLSKSWDTFKTSVTQVTEAVTDLLQKMGLLNTAASEVKFDDAFISSLDKLSTILNALSNALDAVTKLTKGDFKGLGESVNSLKQDLDSYVNQNVMEFATGTLKASARMMLNDRPPVESQGKLSGTIDRQSQSLDEALSRQALTVDVTIPINIEGMIQAGDLATTLKEPLAQAASDAFKQALGSARAQQAERQ